MKPSPPRSFTLLFLIITLISLAGCSGGGSPVATDARDLQADDAVGMRNMSDASEEMKDTPDKYWNGTIDVEGHTWIADISPDGDIHRAVGEGIKLDGSIEDFINAYPDIFKIKGHDLWLMSDEKHGGIRYLIYRQAYDGIPIIDTRVDFRFGRGGKLVMLGADVYESVSAPPASISMGLASDIAVSYHEGEVRESELYIQGLADGTFVPVWRTFVGDWLMLISAIDGRVVEETELIWDYEFDGTVEGEVNQVDPLLPTFVDSLPNTRVRFTDNGNYDTYCDLTGAYHYTTGDYTDILTQVRILGEWINVNNAAGDDADISVTTYEGTPAEFLFDDSNTATTEANVYYWATMAHNHVKDIDSDFTGMDFMLTANVNRSAWCNAMAQWNAINFYKPAGGCLNLGQVADVVIHEYGHVVNYRQYNSDEIPPSSMREGFADYTANTVTDQPVVGLNYKGAGTSIRNSDNTLYWPDNNCGGGGHCLGEYLAGALWDLREAVGANTSDHLWWFAKYGKPTTFPDFATEVCIADDDNDNLLDGTPNYLDIFIAFEQIHGIPVPDAPDYIDITLTVTPDDENPEISSATGGTFGYQIQVHNNLPWTASVEGWAAVGFKSGFWYGPIIPPSHYKGNPVPLYFGPNANFSIHLNQDIPGGMLAPGLELEYSVRMGDYTNMSDSVINAEDSFTFSIIE